MSRDTKYREIPYNYTSFSDREIILKYFDENTWGILTDLRSRRVTGRSAKLFFEIIGDIFIIDRNPYIYNDYLENPHKLRKLKSLHDIRLATIEKGADIQLVFTLIDKVRRLDDSFFKSFKTEKQKRRKILKALGGCTDASNIRFSAFDKVLHVTDATDWRVEYPDAVVYPATVAETAAIVKKAAAMGLKIIPRGGGTGLTGGAVPVMKNTVVINTEKLRAIGEIEISGEPGREIPVVEVEAGAVTDRVMEHCRERGYIFATDPTSAWASTIGGNIAENAGGKKAVMWGTAIDNIYSFRIINHEGLILDVKRRQHPHRKILPDDTVVFDVFSQHRDGGMKFVKSVSLSGNEIRKKGVGKDITNKALGGLPGIQKEGGDGIIVSAKFVLYPPFVNVRTLCLEFFGTDMVNASKAIVEIQGMFPRGGDVYLTALEHFDEKYVTAINYRNKSDRGELPKAVLLIDVESDSEPELKESCSSILDLVGKYNTEGFIAADAEAREKFWKDRKNLGAIAKHTNAFKLNEDVVIPLLTLPEFSDYIEMLNLKKELENCLLIMREIREFTASYRFDDDGFIASKLKNFTSKLDELIGRFGNDSQILESALAGGSDDRGTTDLFVRMRAGAPPSSAMDEALAASRQMFHGYGEIISSINAIIAECKKKKLIIATHMHAGDGNVHVNIPVNSNDYLMMKEADEAAGLIMEKVKRLGGVISGEHGIGLTKLKFIEQEILDAYADYKKENDPNDVFNPGKLRSDFPTATIYTPSLNLIEREAFILETTDLEKLTTSISACLRCGKCKENCNTHYPRATMLFNPRNKILGVSLIVEAVLYEAQTESSLGFRNFTMLRDISDHCTMCHNCLSPCPVKIDFGEVTLSIRSLLVERKKSAHKPVTQMTLRYLRMKGMAANRIFRIALLRCGYACQRLGYYMNRPFAALTTKITPYIAAMLSSRLPSAGKKTLREELGLSGGNTFFSFQKPGVPLLKSVIYFPGCGSERMFSDISAAAVAMLYHHGVRVVIPPEYLCCGYPLLANGKTRDAEMKNYENRVIFHRMADIIGYMDIKDIIVSCGTCYEMLAKYQIGNIFPDAEIIDVNEFIAREGLCAPIDPGERILYHEPCHSPLKTLGAAKTIEALTGKRPVMVPNCCGEGGTLALSTPGISGSLRKRKHENVLRISPDKRALVLTTCPSCVQGLSRSEEGMCLTGKSLVHFIAEQIYGRSWRRDFIRNVKKNSSVERIIF